MKRYHIENSPNRELKEKSDIEDILKRGRYAVISMCRDNEPYIVTLSYGYSADRDALYMHTADRGLKLDFLEANSRVCVTIIEDGGYIEDRCSHAYKSVVFWGTMHTIEQMDEKVEGMTTILNHLEKSDLFIKKMLLKSSKMYSKMKVLRVDIEQIHGKAGQ